MLYTQKINDPIKDRKVLNLCSLDYDSEWLTKNMADKVYILKPGEIDEKIKNGEIDTIFFRASEQSVDGFKIMGKLLRDSDLKTKKCRLIVADDTTQDNLISYVYERMDNLLKFLGYDKEVLAVDGADYFVYN